MAPKVGVLVPTRNRQDLLPLVINQFFMQDYSREDLHLFILDDSDKSLHYTTSPHLEKLNIHYTYRNSAPGRLTLGYKRSKLIEMARNEGCDFMLFWDDDDLQSKSRVSHAVDRLTQTNSHLAGISKLCMFFVDDESDDIYQSRGFGSNHGTAGTLAFSREYTYGHQFLKFHDTGEEAQFTNDFTEPMLQLNPQCTMLCLCHKSNTVDKQHMKDSSDKLPRKAELYNIHHFFYNTSEEERRIANELTALLASKKK